MKNIIYYLSIITLILLNSCSNNIGTNLKFQPENVLSVGSMKESDFLKLLNEPPYIKIIEKNNIRSQVYFYYYFSEDMTSKLLEVEFIDSVLNGYIYKTIVISSVISSFNDSLQKNIKIGSSDMDYVKKLIGFPSSIIRLPSNLIYSIIVPEYFLYELINPPEKSKEIWLYTYQYHIKEGNIIVSYYRYLFLYFDSNNKVISKSYYDNVESDYIRKLLNY